MNSEFCIGGPAVKLNRMNTYFPNNCHDYNIIYTISDRIPVKLCQRAKLRGVKVVCHINSMYYPAYRPDYVERNKPTADILSLADHVVYGSAFAKDAAELYLGRTRAADDIIYNAVDTQHFRPLPGVRKEQFTVLAIGVHYIQHRLTPLIRAMRVVQDAYPNARLLIAGPLLSGEGIFDCGIETIKAEAQDAGFSNIEYLGPYNQQEAPLIYARGSVMVHLKHMDWTPNTVVEALACGLPIVHTGNGGLPELVGQCGISLQLPFDWETIHIPDPEFLAERIIEAYEKRNSLAEMARTRAVQRYDISTWVEAHRTIFDCLLRYPEKDMQ